MNNKILMGMFLLVAFILPIASFASTSEVESPWHNLSQFRGSGNLGAQELNMEKTEFTAWRNQAREEHRAYRLKQREGRLQDALERGCLTEEEMTERLEQRNKRF